MASTRGYLDGVPTAQVGRFETELLARLHSKHQSLLDAIRTGKALTSELEAELNSALKAFAETFA